MTSSPKSLTLSATYNNEKDKCSLLKVKFVCESDTANSVELEKFLEEPANGRLIKGTVKGLQIATEYNCTVKTKNSGGWSNESDASLFRTKDDCTIAIFDSLATLMQFFFFRSK